MKRKISCLLVLTMALSAAGSLSGGTAVSVEAAVVSAAVDSEESNLLSQIENADVTPENLGIPGESHYGTKYYARNIWDMVAVDGKVLLSMGDYATNTGAVPIYYYKNDSTTKYECTYESGRSTVGLSSEEIKRFYEIDGEIYATATDPLGMENASYYKYDLASDKWIDYYKLPLCVHCYDMVEYDGEVFFAGMVRNSNSKIISCVQKLSKDQLCSTSSASNVDFYDMNGNKMDLNVYTYQGASGNMVESVSSPFWRAYDIFVYKGELYIAHSSNTANTRNAKSGLFKYDKKANRFVQMCRGDAVKGFMSVTRNITSYTQAYEDGTMIKDENGNPVKSPVYYSFEDNSAIYSPLTVGQEEVYSEPICGAKISTDNTFVAVCNGIFKSSDVMTFEKVSLGKGYENYVTRDAFEKDGKYYFLASQKNGTDDFTTAVFETDDNFTEFRRVLSFDTKSFARSFVYNEGYLYVGLGGNGRIDNIGDSVVSKYSGTLYRINLSDWISDDEDNTEDENGELTVSLKANDSTSKVNLEVGNTVTLNAAANGGSGNYSYEYVLIDPTSKAITPLTGYISSATYSETLTDVGTKVYAVYVKDSSGKVVVSNTVTATVAAEEPAAELKVNLKANDSTTKVNLEAGNTVTLNATASGGSGNYNYEYVLIDPTSKAIAPLTGYISSATYSETLTDVGTKVYAVYVKDSSGKVVVSNTVTATVAAEEPAAELKVNLKANDSTTKVNLEAGNTVTLNATASGGSGDYSYEYVLIDPASKAITPLTGYISSATYSEPLTDVGIRVYALYVKDSSGKVVVSNTVTVVVKE